MRHIVRLAAAAALLLGADRGAVAMEFAPLKPLDVASVDPSMLADIYGAWELRDRTGKKRCRFVLSREPGIGGTQIQLDPGCAKAFPVMDEIGAWRLNEGWTIDLVDALRKVRVRFETPDERYVAFGDPKDIAGMHELVKLPADPKPRRTR